MATPGRAQVRCFCFWAVLLCAGSAWAAGPIIALFDMEDRGSKLDREVLLNLIDYLAAKLTEGGYEVVPPDQVRDRIKTQRAETHKTCYDQGCQIELGKELAAQKTLSTKILRIGNTCQVTAVMYDLRRATAERATTAEAKCDVDELLAAVKKISDNLTRALADKPSGAIAKPIEAEVPKAEKKPLAKAETKPAPKIEPPAPLKTEPKAQSGEKELLASVPPPTPKAGGVTEVQAKIDRPSSAYNTWGHVALWSGVGLVAAGGGAMMLALNAADDYTKTGSEDSKSSSKMFTGMMYAGFGLGAAAIATGITLWMMDPGPEKQAVTASASLLPLPGGMAATLTGTW